MIIGNRTVIGEYITYDYVGDGSSFRFLINENPSSKEAIEVVVGGVYQSPQDYSLSTVSGNVYVDFGTPVTPLLKVFIKINAKTVVFGTPSNGAVSDAKVAANMFPNYISGGIPVNGADTDNDIIFTHNKASISFIEAGSDDRYLYSNINEDITKQLDAPWVEGGTGGLASSMTKAADTTYHLFDIMKDDGTLDCGFDTNINAVNLLSDASGYNKYRRIGSVLTDGSGNIRPFTATEISGGGVEVSYKSNIVEVNDPSGVGIASLISVNLPFGIHTYGKFFCSRYCGDTTFVESIAEVLDYNKTSLCTAVNGVATYVSDTYQNALSDTNSQVYVKAYKNTNAHLNIKILGFIDLRI